VKFNALDAHGIKVMSIGNIIESTDTPLAWRGPIATRTLVQLLQDTKWGDLDYLIIDLPPGTGDIQLTLAQKVPVTGAVVVTTPQDIALLDAQKAFRLFQKVHIPVLGVIENMSQFHCEHCGQSTALFGTDGGRRFALKYSLELLGQLPLTVQIREDMDKGVPTVVSNPTSASSLVFSDIARKLSLTLSTFSKNYAAKFPKIVVENI